MIRRHAVATARSTHPRGPIAQPGAVSPESILPLLSLDGSFVGVAGAAVLVLFSAACGIAWSMGRTVAPAQSPDMSAAPPSGRNADQVHRRREFVHPTDRVLQHLRANDGRMRQSDLVDEMDKSAASVSRYLTELEDGDLIRRVRVGGRNVVLLGDGSQVGDGWRQREG